MALTPEEERLVQKRVSDSTCARCRRPIRVGHRIQAAYIVTNPNAYNPNKLTERGIELGCDNEFAHISCSDPFLEGKDAHKFSGL